MNPNFRLLAACCFSSLPLAAFAITPGYTVLDLSAPGRSAFGLNDSGQVLYSTTVVGASTPQHIYTITGANGQGVVSSVELGADALVTQHGFNDAGQIAGAWTNAKPGTPGGFYTGPNGQSLTTLPGNVSGINNVGQVVGSMSNSQLQLFYTKTDGTVVSLAGSYGFAKDINDKGFFLASVLGADSSGHMTAKDDVFNTGTGTGAFTVAPLLSVDLNNNNVLVGTVTDRADNRDHAAFAGPNGLITEVSNPAGQGGSSMTCRGVHINDGGQVLGICSDYFNSSLQYAFVTGLGGSGVSILDTPDNRTDLLTANLNERGQVLLTFGGGYNYLFTPSVPEAESSAMMLLGLISMIALNNGRKRSA